MEDIVNPAEESTIATSEALDALGIKCGSTGIPDPRTPLEVIALASEDMAVHASSATAEKARPRNPPQTSEARAASLELELPNCGTYVNEIAATNSALHDRVFVAETLLKDVNDARNVQRARLRDLEDESTSLLFQ